MTARSERIEAMKKILLFLYWEETVDEGYLTINRMQEETDLSRIEIQEGLRNLGHSGHVNYVYRDKALGIEEARITLKGKEKASQLLSDEFSGTSAPEVFDLFFETLSQILDAKHAG